jgi:aminoglycoside phosphotransferase (APT) family kinase protein
MASADREVDEVREVVRKYLPSYDVESVVTLGEGLDHWTYEVDGDLVVRIDRHGHAGSAEWIRRECHLLELLATVSPVPVPRPLFCAAEDGVLAYRKLGGQCLLDVPPAVAAALGRLLAVLHAVPPGRLEGLVDVDDPPLSEWQEEAARLVPTIARHLSPGQQRAVRELLASQQPPSSTRGVFSHNDLGIEHVLVDPRRGTITGVLDWSDAAIVDPARDFGLVFRDLGPAALGEALKAYGADPEEAARLRERAVFYGRCTGLADLAYGLETGLATYVDKSVASLAWLFGE